MSVEEGWAWNSDLGQSHISVDWAVGGFSGTQNLKLLVPKKIGSSCFQNVGFPKMWNLWDQNVLLISFLSHAPVAIHDRHYINGSKIGQHLITNGVYIMFVCLFVCCTQGWQMYTRHLEMEAYDLRSLSEWIWELEQWQLCKFWDFNSRFWKNVWDAGFVNLRCKTSTIEVWKKIGKGGSY